MRESSDPQEVSWTQLGQGIYILMGCSHCVILGTVSHLPALKSRVIYVDGIHVKRKKKNYGMWTYMYKTNQYVIWLKLGEKKTLVLFQSW